MTKTEVTTEETPGYNRAAVAAWIKANVSGLELPLTWKRLPGGHSNLTYALQDAHGRQAVIRRPPIGELLPKAHDMAREWAVISALKSSAVPVPQALGFCEDPAVTGAHFYVMSQVNGYPLYNASDTERLVPQAMRVKLAHSFIDVLAELHSLDPIALGLADLGKQDSYIARQLKTWYRSWTASMGPAEYDDPRAHSLQAFFLANLPDQGPIRLVHGDYGFHNTLVGPDCTLAAVVDWEISTLGDPLADLAYALNQWPDPSDPKVDDSQASAQAKSNANSVTKFVPLVPAHAATAVPGFPGRKALAQRYAERTGRDLSRLDYYIGFNRWKTAAIVHGVYARYCEGKKSSEGVDLVELRQRIDFALTQAEQAVARL